MLASLFTRPHIKKILIIDAPTLHPPPLILKYVNTAVLGSP